MSIDVSRNRHSGLLIPLFSIPSSTSWGIGEICDIPVMSRWLKSAGQHFMQMLPINEMAPGQTSPYSAITAMAIDPIYISLRFVEDFKAAGGEAALDAESRETLEEVRAASSIDYERVRNLKHRALTLAFDRFRNEESRGRSWRAGELNAYIEQQRWWLDDYALFRALHAGFDERPWMNWPEPIRKRQPEAIKMFSRDLAEEIRFYQYLQWLADSQWRSARAKSEIALFGDLPFMVDTDSADVWAHQDLFDLDASVGVPPDAFSETGQDWGLPVYRWDVMQRRGDEWLRERARRSAALYDGYRIDHLVGFYRTYVIPKNGSKRYFRPEKEPAQIVQGERVLGVFGSEHSRIIAEDLGVVPDFVRDSLARLGIPGYKVLRWEREWQEEGQPFRDPTTYPPVSVATSGTHDTEPMATWWDGAEAEERERVGEIPMLRKLATDCEFGEAPFTSAVRDALLEVLVASGSDLLILPVGDVFGWRDRINVPATVTASNWTYRLPWPVDMLDRQPEAHERVEKLRAWCEKYHRA